MMLMVVVFAAWHSNAPVIPGSCDIWGRRSAVTEREAENVADCQAVSAERDRLWAALRTRRLTGAEMSRVLAIGEAITFPHKPCLPAGGGMVCSVPSREKMLDEFYRALKLQAVIRSKALKAGGRP